MARRKGINQTDHAADIIGGTPDDDLLVGTPGDDRLNGGAGWDTLYGLGGNDFLNGQGQNDELYGGDGNDTLIGMGANDILDGGAGADRMEGGEKSDTYIVDNVRDVVIEGGGSTNGGADTVYSSITYTLGNNVEHLYLTGSANLNGTGNGDDNNIIGNDGNNVIRGLGGYDVIDGGAGNDRLEGGADGDQVEGGLGADTVLGGAGDDILGGNQAGYWTPSENDFAGDLVEGGAGDDWLTGNTGDTLIGGTGDDRYFIYEDITTLLIEQAGGGDDGIVIHDRSYTLQTNFEGLDIEKFGDADIVATGNNAANSLSVFNYAAGGSVELHGLGGNDHLYYARAYIDGEPSAYLDGGAGNDTLYGATGGDTLIGGAGNDYIFVDAQDTATGGAGSDEFTSSPWVYMDFGHITDFEGNADSLTLSTYGSAEQQPPGMLAASAFYAGTSATTAAQRYIYDAGTGALYYDSDGNGANAQVQIADITVVSGTFNHQDIELVS